MHCLINETMSCPTTALSVSAAMSQVTSTHKSPHTAWRPIYCMAQALHSHCMCLCTVFCWSCAVKSSAAEIWSPGRQMRPMNPPGGPGSYHRWSVWRPMDSLSFAGNVLEWKWREWDDSIDALISNAYCALVKWGPCVVHFYHFLIGCMVSADYWLADYPELRRTTQRSTIGGPFGEPGCCKLIRT